MATTKQKLIGLCTSIKTLERLITQLKEDAIKLKQDIKEETTAKVVQDDVKLAVYRKRKTGTQSLARSNSAALLLTTSFSTAPKNEEITEEEPRWKSQCYWKHHFNCEVLQAPLCNHETCCVHCPVLKKYIARFSQYPPHCYTAK
jgi:hypothetical protein